MRSEMARRFAGVSSRFLGLPLGAGFLRAFVVGVLAAVCVDDVLGAISMPNISERSSLASTFEPAGVLRVFDRSDPAFAIKSCRSTLRSVKSNSG